MIVTKSNKANRHKSRAPSNQQPDGQTDGPTDGPIDGPTKQLIEKKHRRITTVKHSYNHHDGIFLLELQLPFWMRPSHPNKPVCLSVGPSLRRSVAPSVRHA